MVNKDRKRGEFCQTGCTRNRLMFNATSTIQVFSLLLYNDDKMIKPIVEYLGEGRGGQIGCQVPSSLTRRNNGTTKTTTVNEFLSGKRTEDRR